MNSIYGNQRKEKGQCFEQTSQDLLRHTRSTSSFSVFETSFEIFPGLAHGGNLIDFDIPYRLEKKMSSEEFWLGWLPDFDD